MPEPGPSDWVELLVKCPVLEGLGPEQVRALAANINLRTLRPGEEVISHLAREDAVFFVLKGQLRVSLSSAIGRQVAIRRLSTGDYFGEIAALTGAPRTAKVAAETEALVGECAREPFMALMHESSALASAIARDLARKVVHLTDRVFELSALEVRFRIYAELLRMARSGERTLEGIVIKEAPTHEMIAAAVGAQREAVSREFGQLAAEGVLRQSKRQIVVLNEDRLRELVERRGGLTATQIVDWPF